MANDPFTLSPAEQKLILALRANAPAEQQVLGRKPAIWSYIRWSHTNSSESRLSESTQTTAITHYVEGLVREHPEHTVAQPLVEEAVSASKIRLRNRPIGRVLCRAVQPGDIVVFARLDRSFRNVRDMSTTVRDWIDRDIYAHFVDVRLDLSQPYGRLIAHLLASIAEWESDYRSQRSKEVASELRRRGRPYGMPACWEYYEGPEGYKVRRFIPELWRDVLLIYVARKRNKWKWTTISAFLDASLAQEENRPPWPKAMQQKRRWPPRKCCHTAYLMGKRMAGDPALAEQVTKLCASDIALPMLWAHCPPPSGRLQMQQPEDNDRSSADHPFASA
jgi:putative DNA-invertase from lambdoid prophage Rac